MSVVQFGPSKLVGGGNGVFLLFAMCKTVAPTNIFEVVVVSTSHRLFIARRRKVDGLIDSVFGLTNMRLCWTHTMTSVQAGAHSKAKTHCFPMLDGRNVARRAGQSSTVSGPQEFQEQFFSERGAAWNPSLDRASPTLCWDPPKFVHVQR